MISGDWHGVDPGVEGGWFISSALEYCGDSSIAVTAGAYQKNQMFSSVFSNVFV